MARFASAPLPKRQAPLNSVLGGLQTVIRNFSESEPEFQLLTVGEREAYSRTYPSRLADPDFDEDRIAWLLTQHRTIYVAYRENVPCGYIVLHALNDFSAEIASIFVVEESRGKGITRVMLNFVSQKLRDDGVTVLKLAVGATNVEAIRAYEANGFVTQQHLMELRLDEDS